MNILTSTEAVPASLTYEPYFGLREKPFSLSSDPRFLYTGPSHVRAFEQLLAGIKRREGVIVLSGEIGTGKTTLCRGVLGALDRRTFSTFVRDPFLSREDLLKTLLIDFGVMSIDDLKSGRLSGASRPDLSYPLYEFLDSLVPLQAFAVLIIDEAQNLSHALLEEIRILSELEAREKLLQVVLVGQPELRSTLKLPQLRQVDQRVSVRCELSPLPAEEVALYIAHRLGVASVGAPAVEFTAEAARLVARAAGGVPRVINLICDRALHRGFVARAANIDAAIVFGAVEDLGRAIEVEQPLVVASVAHSPAGAVPPDDRSKATVAPPSSPVATGAAVDQTGDPDRSQPDLAPRAAPVADAERHAVSPGPAFGPGTAAEKNAGRYDSDDPLAEFSQEADLARARRGWSRVAGVAAVAALVASAAAGVWFTRERELAAVLPSRPLTSAPTAAVTNTAMRSEAAPLAIAAPVQSGAISQAADAAPPAAPQAAAGPAYVIQVASFQSRARAQRLIDELNGAGYQAESVDADLGPRGIWIQVLVGRYGSLAEAEADLAGIRERPSYRDARVIALSE